MELPHLGTHCTKTNCNKLDFLPIKCDACNEIFCAEHYQFNKHNCKHAYKKDNQVPVCPLCNKPVPVGVNEEPDAVVGRHIDNDCQSDSAFSRRKIFTNKCSYRGCKVKELVPVVCNDCNLNYCFRHRLPEDHKCTPVLRTNRLTKDSWLLKQPTNNRSSPKPVVNHKAPGNQKAPTNHKAPASNKTPGRSLRNEYQGNLSEDEALARALAMSTEPTASKKLTQEELDFALAQQLQSSEHSVATGAQRANSVRDRCHLS